MTKVNKLNFINKLSRQNIKNTLGYAVKNRNGNYRDIRWIDKKNGETVDSLETAGYIKVNRKIEDKETYTITEDGDLYYKDVFGRYSYWGRKLSGKFERFKKRLFNKKERN